MYHAIRTALTIITYTLFFFATNPAYARWAVYDEAELETEFYNRELIIHEDGTLESVVEVRQKILKEQARASAANYRLVYDSGRTTLSVLEAKTINGSEEFKVEKDRIEDKTLASIGYGFDDQKQLLIAYPNLAIGSEIYVKYKEKEIKPLLGKVYTANLFFGTDSYWKSSQVKISSKLPLHIMVNDPDGALEIVKDKDDNFYHAKITLKKPLYKETVNEPRDGVMDYKNLTWVSISTFSKWEELGKKMAPLYDKVASQPLPALLEDIAKSARAEAGDVNRIDKVTSLLNEKIQYMGDWRTTEGRLVPRDLEKIASTRVGDCKDFTIATVAILRKLGFKAYPTLVMRGEEAVSLNLLPTLSSFNHAMVKAISESGVVYWIDPTNAISMAGRLFPDITNKMTLVLDEAKPVYERIPQINPAGSKVERKSVVTLQKGSYVTSHHGRVKLSGEVAANLTGYDMYYSKQQLKDIIFRLVTGVNLEENMKKNIILPDLSSRIVQDIVTEYDYDRDDDLIKTNLGPAMYLEPHSIVETVTGNIPNQVTDLYIGPPVTVNCDIFIKNASAGKLEALNYTVESPWLIVKREFKKKDGGIEINSIISVLRSFISKEELESAAYRDLKASLTKEYKNVSIVFDRN